MASERTSRLPRLQGLTLWVPITALLALGLITTLVDLWGLPTREAARANAARQRFVVNTATGEILLGKANPEAEEKFDVGTAEEAATATEGEPTEHATSTTEAPPTPEAEPLPEGTPSLRTTPLSSGPMEMPSHTKDSLVSAPAREVTELVDGLQLPKRGDKDTLPSKLYARPFKRQPEQVLLSFVVMDAGIDPQSIGLLMRLPPQVSVAYSPYTHAETSYSEHLRALGHEVWTMLPTMDSRYPNTDPGPLGIIAKMPAEETIHRTQEVLAAVVGSVGVILPPDETIVLQKDTLSPALGEINKRGLLLLSTHPSRNIDQITTNEGLAQIIRRADLILDPTPNESQIRSKLAGLLNAATEKGDYVVMLSSRPQTLQILDEWLKETVLNEPYALAPLTAIYQPKEAPEPKEEAKEEGGGHGGGEKKEKPKPKPVEKKKKPLPQDKYLTPAGAEGGGHGGGEKSSGGH